MTEKEEAAWHWAGLQCDGCEFDDWDKEAIIRYGRTLHESLLNEIHELRLQNSGQAALIERYKDKIAGLLSPSGRRVKKVSDL